MSKTETESHALLVSKLAIERCQRQVAHLNALMHLCGAQAMGINNIVSDNAHEILTTMERELASSARALEECF